MDRPERTAALDYLRRKGTDAAASRLLAGLRATLQRFEQTVDRVPEPLRSRRPQPAAWSVHEVVDHLVETHRPAVTELRALCAGVSPAGPPIPARLTSADPLSRPWQTLVDDLKGVHADILAIVERAGDAASLQPTAAFVMVVKAAGESGPEVLEWIEQLDWKAYAQALRLHTHEHAGQVERTIAALEMS
jgi:DinB superfamily